MPPFASKVWQRVHTPYGSFLATTAMVAIVMSCVGDQVIMGMLCVVLLFAWCFNALFFWARQDAKRQIEFIRWNLRRMFAVIGCLAVILGSLIHHWPLKLRFTASLPELDEFADRLEGGFQMPKPTAVGLFVVRKAEMRGDLPCLWTDPDSAGYKGFVRCAPDQAERFNLWCNERMNDRWQLIIED